MPRKLAFLLLPLVLLLAACNSGGDKSGSAPTEVADPPGSDAQATDDSAVATDDADSASGDDAGGDPFAAFNPFDVLGGLSGSAASMGEPDPTLAAALLTAGDLPGDFLDMGSFGYSVPSEAGDLDLAASMFMSGDVESGEFNAIVMSAAAVLPPEALEDMGSFDLSEDDLDEIESLAGESGLGFAEIDVLDADGLGESGFGMRMTMDIAGLLGALGAPEEDNPFADGIAMEMYGFLDGDQMRMVIVMAPAGGSTGVDARDLAEAMDAR
ncbi:MAG: hypothetical protein WEE64_08515 [Dehalococcoidia bacterium]